MKTENTLTLAEVASTPNTIPLGESLIKDLDPEECGIYNDLTSELLLSNQELPTDVRVMALSLLKTFSHLLQNKDKLKQQAEAFPLTRNRDIYYQVPFLPEVIASKNMLSWYHQEMKWVNKLKQEKGNYSSLRTMILFYESVVFHVATSKKNKKKYLSIADELFKKIMGHFQTLNTAYQKQDNSHPWFSIDKVNEYKAVALLWKNVVDTTTVRHSHHLPDHLVRSHNKLPVDWAELLKIGSHKKITMINVIYPLKCLMSSCREIRTFSSFLLQLVCKERPDFITSIHRTRVPKVFVNRLILAHKLKKSYPQLPEKVPEKLMKEMFLVLTEQAIHSLAAKHKVKEKGVKNLSKKFNEFSEQVQIKDEIQVTGPDMEVVDIELEKPVSDAPKTEVKIQEPVSDKVIEIPDLQKVPTDFSPITDEQEFGMGIQSMPYVFPLPFYSEEIPLQHVPNIKWDEMKWSDSRSEKSNTHVYTAEAHLFIKKLEKVESYRYDMCYVDQIDSIKTIKKYHCFIAQQGIGKNIKYYIAVKKPGIVKDKSRVLIELELSDNFMEKIKMAYFFILPPPYGQHFLAIPK